MKKKQASPEWKSDVKAPPGSRQEPPAEAPSEPREPAKGLECRSCGCGHFEVVYTRPAIGGRIQRCRACRNCGRRMMTYEIPAKDPKAIGR